MLWLGMSFADRQKYHDLLQDHHTIVVVLTLMDLDHREIAGGDITARLMGGQVTVDASSEITRSLDLDLLDPNGALHLDSRSPDAGAMFADRMIRVRYVIINPERTKRYAANAFTGPITKLERNGAAIKIECLGKEIFGLTPVWNERTFKKGFLTTNAIKVIVRDLMGETEMSIPDLKFKLRRNVSIGKDKLPWQVAKQLAADLGFQLFFDGSGECQMRRMPKGSVFTFRSGRSGSVKTEADVGFDISNVVNAVEVFGKKPVKKKGQTKKKRPHAKLVAARSHPLSPWALGRKGGPRYLPVVIEDDSITTDLEAKRRCRLELDRRLLESIDVAYDTLTIPHLEEMDVITLRTSKFTARHRARKFAIGLTSDAGSTMGYVKNLKPRAGLIRHHRRGGR